MEENLKYYQYSPLALAYIGDSILDLMVKDHFVKAEDLPVEKYHRKVSDIVNARTQSAYADSISDSFTEKESDIFRRGRNSSPHTKAKNATMTEYKKATGFEAVLGYLYLTKNEERMSELVKGLIGFSENKTDDKD